MPWKLSLLPLAILAITHYTVAYDNFGQNSTTPSYEVSSNSTISETEHTIDLLQRMIEDETSALIEAPRLFDFSSTSDDVETGRKKKNQMANVLPMFVAPFLIQSAMIPVMLSILKFMLLASFTVGKLALVFSLANSLKSSNRHEEPERIMYAHSGHWR